MTPKKETGLLLREDSVATKFHMRLDIRGALMNWENRMFEGMFKTDDGKEMHWREAKYQLMEELQKGHNYIPYGDCPGFDPVEKGCPGHPVEAKP